MTVTTVDPLKWKRRDFAGRVFGRLTVLRFSRKGLSRFGKEHEYWMCKCSCPKGEAGAEYEAARRNLVTGTLKSCGCLKVEVAKKRKSKHGFATYRAKDDPSKNGFYSSWSSMIQRLKHPTYIRRGITIEDDRWRTFDNYKDDMLPLWAVGLQLDRIDNNRGYCKENCRFVTRKINMNNTSKTRYVEYKGERIAVALLAERVGLPYGCLMTRIQRKWDINDAVERPFGCYMPNIKDESRGFGRRKHALPSVRINYLTPPSRITGAWCI